MEYKKLDRESWPRRELFDFFSAVSHPFYSVTFKLDVTNLYSFTKKNSVSFYYALTYLVTKALNSVESFRYALVDGEPVLLSERIPSFTDLHDGSESFHIVTMPCTGDIVRFCREAKRRSLAQTRLIDPEQEGDNLIFVSCLPWIELTSLTNERNFDRDDSVPRVAWGKYRDEDGRKTLGFSMELNHRFVDGVHIGKFSEKLTELINELK